MGEPFWLAEAVAACPDQAAEFSRLNTALQTLPDDASMGSFIDYYERMLEARDRLYEAWLTQELEAE
jgi:hypothetical protein